MLCQPGSAQRKPIIARIDTKSGHGAGKPTQKVRRQIQEALQARGLPQRHFKSLPVFLGPASVPRFGGLSPARQKRAVWRPQIIEEMADVYGFIAKAVGAKWIE